MDEQFELLQLLEQINDGDATHIQALLEPTLALLDPEDLVQLTNSRSVQIVATEYMNTVMRKRVVGTTYRFRRRLHQSLSELGIVPAGMTRNKLAVLAGKKDLLIPCLVDLCVKTSEGATVVRQYFSPPPSLRLHELSPDVRKLLADLLLDVDPERLAQRFLQKMIILPSIIF